ncbi:MAG: phosphoenolpyruvate--protein phosphotransferase, partial [Lachnospiraceae bacterium]|nr:phosphoenolpyruvate--protein phosphotransferase [Lachnospiraceae bacterium]
MMQLKGKSVFKGIAVGPVLVLRQEEQKVRRSKVDDPDAEMERVRQAVSAAQEQLQKLYDKAVAEVGEASAAIFEVHQMMLEDEDYLDAINNMIQTELVGAEYAVAVTGDNFSEMFAGMDDDYMKARAADVKDISNRLIQCLSGNGENGFELREPSIIVADDLSPSETVQMDKQKILAIVTVHGSANSHTSILARMMNIPALIGVSMDLDKISSGMKAVVDGMQGEVIFEPDELVCME